MLDENLDDSKSGSNGLFSRNPFTPQTCIRISLIQQKLLWFPSGAWVQRTDPIVPWACLPHSWEQSEAGLQTPGEAPSGAYLLSEYNYGASNLLCLVLNFSISTCPVLGLLCAPLPGDRTQGFRGARQAAHQLSSTPTLFNF